MTLARLIEAVVEHDFDPVWSYCLRCGAGMEDVMNQERGACSPTNVIAVSHLIAERRMNGFCGDAILRAMEGRDG